MKKTITLLFPKQSFLRSATKTNLWTVLKKRFLFKWQLAISFWQLAMQGDLKNNELFFKYTFSSALPNANSQRPTAKKNDLLLTIIISCFGTALPGVLNAQYCTMACNTSVNVSLSADCEGEITYDMILEGSYTSATCSPNGPGAFVVVVMDQSGAPLQNSPYVDSTHIGNSYLVKVKHWASGNNCWGEIHVEDKLAPSLSCPPDITVACSESTATSVTGEATATDCSEFIMGYNDSVTKLNCNGSGLAGFVKRSWAAVDIYGNEKACLQTINVELPKTGDIEWPLNLDDIAAPSLDCVGPETDPAHTGTPTINGQPIPNGVGFCNMAYDHDDLVISLCENSYKILRTWTVVYWCTGAILNHTQVIAVKDKTAPNLSCPLPFTVGTTSSSQCKASVIMPTIAITDNCSSNFTVTMNTPNGWVTGNGGVIHNVNTGTFTITYQATDDCKNTASCTTQLTVEDDDSPTVICDEFTVTTLNNTGTAIIFANTFDDGTYDNCGYFSLSVRRMDGGCNSPTTFEPTVTFCCQDAGEDIQVEMQATDGSGNTNSCTVNVHVDDNSEPAILCPPGVTITCLDDPTDLNLTGTPQTVIACGSSDVTFTDDANLNNCGTGILNRTWTASGSNGSGNSCVQVIEIVDNTPVSITFPSDYTVSGCVSPEDLMPENLPAGFDYPTAISDCEQIATNVSDQIFNVAAPACFKIIRTWTVINKCTYQVGGNTGIWTDTQVIYVSDDTAPEFTCPSNIEVEVDANCKGTVVLPQITDIMDCSDDTQVFISTDLGLGNGPFNNVNPGNYEATYTVFDGCGNHADCTISINVVDLKKPTPYCKPGIVIEIMGVDTDGDGLVDDGMATTWAVDFNEGSSDNCPGALKYSFSSNVAETGVEFDCGDLGQNTVEIWVTDASGNQDFCVTSVIIQDNMGVCSGNLYANVGGAITNEEGEDVENVQVSINDGVTPPAMTNSNGNFEFSTLPLGNDFTVTPEKNAALLNGVTTYDIVLISKHVLDVAKLDSPYKLIAADVNNSGSVTTYDMVVLQKNILYVDSSFPDNTSWRFVDKDFSFADPANPFADDFPELYNINNFQGNMSEVDFIAVKIGDVNGTASTNMQHDPLEDRSGELLVFNAKNEELLAGNEYRLDITSDNFDHIIGFQFTLDFDPTSLEYIRVENGDLPSLTNTNFGQALLDRGAITSSWNHTEPISLEKGDVLFTLVFRVKTDTDWASVLALSSTYTIAEAYFDGGEQLDLELLFEQTPFATTSANTPPVVSTVRPNPFHNSTVIGFKLTQPQEVTLTVFDNAGRTVGTVSEFFETGEQSMTLGSEMLNGAGHYFYRLETTDGVCTGQLVLID